MACIYLHFQQPDQQIAPSKIIASLLRQLVQQKRMYPVVEAILVTHGEYEKNEVPPSAEQYLELLLAEMNAFRQVYLVLDALESCNQSAFVLEIINKLPQSVKVLLTTRSGSLMGDELSIRGGGIQLEVKAHASDIKAYVKSRISRDRHLHGFTMQEGDSTFRDTVIHSIEVGAGDMYVTYQPALVLFYPCPVRRSK